MISPKPNLDDFPNTESGVLKVLRHQIAERNYKRARAEHAIEALRHYIDYGYDRSHAVKIVAELTGEKQ